jgi:hypothetical protein
VPIGTRVPRARMREGARNNAEAVRRNGVKFCYAENWIYAPPIEKMRRLIAASKGSILELRAEENHSGSNSVFSRDWKSTGGGAFVAHGGAFGRGVPALETMGRPVAAGKSRVGFIAAACVSPLSCPECRPIRSGPATTHGSRQLYAHAWQLISVRG